MAKKLFLSLVFVLSIIILNLGQALASSVPESFAPLVERAMPAVVNISTTQKVEVKNPFGRFNFHNLPQGKEFDMFREFFERQLGPEGATRKAHSLGSGFIIDPKGYIVTNHHVVKQADEIRVSLGDDSQKTYKAKVIGSDAKTDLALIKIEVKKALPYVDFGDSDSAKVGDWTLAIGNPYGFGGSVTAGIISAKSRYLLGQYDDFIQTDTSINRGNSGGPLFDMNGKVIGVNSVIVSPSGGNIGIGFAIPSSTAKPIIDQLRSQGKIVRGWLGVKIQLVTEDIAVNLGLEDTKGALVAEVVKGSPAEKAGIMVGDIITKFNGREVKRMQMLPRIVAETKIGKKAKVEIFRNGKYKTIKVKVEKPDDADWDAPEGSKPKQEPKSDVATYHGMQIGDITKAARSKYKIDKELKGALLIAVKRNSVAGEIGLKDGDVVIRFNQRKIESAEELIDNLKRVKKAGAKNAVMLVSRGGKNHYVVIDIE